MEFKPKGIRKMLELGFYTVGDIQKITGLKKFKCYQYYKKFKYELERKK